MHKTLLKALLLILLIDIILISGIYLYLIVRIYSIEQTLDTEDVDSTQSITDGWKTYTDGKNKFQFKYPQDWYSIPGTGYESFALVGIELLPTQNDGKDPPDVTIEIYVRELKDRENNAMTKVQYITEYYSEYSDYRGYQSVRRDNINGKEMLFVENQSPHEEYTLYEYVYFEDEKVYSFYAHYAGYTENPDLVKGYRDFKDIVATLEVFK